ncbi:MAG: hypothetical protein HY303_01650, partial [Candidatus Wallbacteria bacterium]|nr:hypothetical protein [Candidatus Wallbacteria bacterium]
MTGKGGGAAVGLLVSLLAVAPAGAQITRTAAVLETFAGGGRDLAPATGTAARHADFSLGGALAAAPDGAILVTVGEQVYRIASSSPATDSYGGRLLELVAGTAGIPDSQTPCPAPADGDLAALSCLGSTYSVTGVAFDSGGRLLIAEAEHKLLFRVSGSRLTAIAGQGSENTAEGVPAIQASLDGPLGLAASSEGAVFVSEVAPGSRYRIREIDAQGNIRTVVGGGQNSLSESILATAARLDSEPRFAATTTDLYYTDRPSGSAGARLRRVAGARVTTVTTLLADPLGLAVSQRGEVYISLGKPLAPRDPDALAQNYRVLRVLQGGRLQAVAGDGETRFAGDGCSPSLAGFSDPGPGALALTADGTLYISDGSSGRVRRLVNREVRLDKPDLRVGLAQFLGIGLAQSLDLRGTRVTVHLSLTDPEGLGSYDLQIAVDPLQEVDEAREADNDFPQDEAVSVHGDLRASLGYSTGPSSLPVVRSGDLSITATFSEPIQTAPSFRFEPRDRANPDGIPMTRIDDTTYRAVYPVNFADGSAVLDGLNRAQLLNATDRGGGSLRSIANDSIVFRTGPAGPDLRVSALSATTSAPTTSDRISIDLAVANDGTMESGPFQVRLLLSHALTEVLTFPSLAPLATAARPMALTIPPTRVPVTLTVVAQADPANAVREAFETNNELRQDIPIVAGPATALIDTVAGTDRQASAGDGGAAAAASLDSPTDVAATAEGKLYIAEAGRVREVDLGTGLIRTFAGGRSGRGRFGDGGPAAQASLFSPTGLALSPGGDLFIADSLDPLYASNLNEAVRRVEASSGDITSTPGLDTAQVPYRVAAGPAGEVLASLQSANRVAVLSGTVPGLPAVAASPRGVRIDASRVAFVGAAPGGDRTITEFNRATRTSSVVAGGGVGLPADGSTATDVTFQDLDGLEIDRATGSLLMTDASSGKLWRVDGTGATRTVRRIAGAGDLASPGDGGPALEARLAGPSGISADPAPARAGVLYVAETLANRVRRIVDPSRLSPTDDRPDRAQDTTAADAVAIGGAPKPGEIFPVRDVDYFELQATAGEAYTVAATSPSGASTTSWR